MSAQPIPFQSRDEQQARWRRRDHANLEAMQNLILQGIVEETGVPFPPKLRAFISALQSAHGGGVVAHEPFKRSHLSIANYLQFKGSDVAREARVRRLIECLEDFQNKTGVLLIRIKRGGELRVAEDGSQQHTATEYTDFLKPTADAAVMRARADEAWKTNPGVAKAAQLESALSELPKFDPESEESDSQEQELWKYAEAQRGRLEKSAAKTAGRIKEKGGNGPMWLRELAKRLLREAEMMDRPEGDGVTNLLPREAENPSNSEEKPNMLSAALSYARAGIPVFPVRPNKAPYTAHGFKDATIDEEAIRAWWRKWPDANIAVPTGVASGWLAIDSDPRHGGDASLSALITENGDLPETLEQETGGKGHHIIFEYPELAQLGNSPGNLPEGLDVRGEGGYIIVAPSLHASGGRYAWRNAFDPVPVPEWLLKMLTEEKKLSVASTKESHAQPKSGAATGDLTPEGHRHNKLKDVACAMRGQGHTFDEILLELTKFRNTRCHPGITHSVSDDELLSIARSVMKYPTNAEKARLATIGA